MMNENTASQSKTRKYKKRHHPYGNYANSMCVNLKINTESLLSLVATTT